MKIIKYLFISLFLLLSFISVTLAATIEKHWEGNLDIRIGNTTQTVTQPTQANQEQISNFRSEITIKKDTSLSIKETINYETSTPHHGIFRYIPVKYNRNGLNYSTTIHNLKITDENGNSQPFSTSFDNKFITYKIGDPNATFVGKKTYILTYTVDNALKQYEKYDELYWDITGEGWNIPILKSQAVVFSPYATINAVICYTGPVGSDDKQCNYGSKTNEGNFFYNKTIGYNDNFTVAVALSKTGVLHFPSTTQKLIKTIRDNWWLLSIPLPALIMFILWYIKGRDYIFISPNVYNLDPHQPQKLKPLFFQDRVPYVYEPFKNLTPGEAGTILDEKVDNQDMIAEIIELARKKYLKIDRIEKESFLHKDIDYQFTLLKLPDSSLPSYQTFLLASLFTTNTIGMVSTLSELKGIFYKYIPEIKDKLSTTITGQGLFTSNPSTTRAKYLGITSAFYFIIIFLAKELLMRFFANINFDSLIRSYNFAQVSNLQWSILIGAVIFAVIFKIVRTAFRNNSIAVSIVFYIILLGSPAFVGVLFGIFSLQIFVIFVFISSLIMTYVFAYNMPQKTAVGSNLHFQVEGLKETIKRGDWREKIKEKHLFIEEVLPFAISLGVVKQLTKDMEDLNLQPPSYFSGVYSSNMTFNSFVSSFNSQVASNLSYNPSSSSWSGGSGFSGGSSGGGGGGGGGGSW